MYDRLSNGNKSHGCSTTLRRCTSLHAEKKARPSKKIINSICGTGTQAAATEIGQPELLCPTDLQLTHGQNRTLDSVIILPLIHADCITEVKQPDLV